MFKNKNTHFQSFVFFFFFKDDYNVEGEKACLLSVRFTKSVMKAADLKCISCHLLSLSLTVQYLLIFWEWQCWDPSKPRLYANCHRVLGISLGLTSTAAVTTGNCSQLSSELKLTCRSPHSTMGEVSPTSNGQLMNYIITARESYPFGECKCMSQVQGKSPYTSPGIFSPSAFIWTKYDI